MMALQNPELLELLKPKKRHKFGAKAVTIDGVKFPSRAEGGRYCQLRMEEREGKIKHLELHPAYTLTAGIRYIADFRYRRDGKETIEDVKGRRTREFILKKKLFEAQTGKKLIEIRMNARAADSLIAVYTAFRKG